MSRRPELYQWIDAVVMSFLSLRKLQALGLALWRCNQNSLIRKSIRYNHILNAQVFGFLGDFQE